MARWGEGLSKEKGIEVLSESEWQVTTWALSDQGYDEQESTLADKKGLIMRW